MNTSRNFTALALILAAGGCAAPRGLPPVAQTVRVGDETRLAFDMNADGRPDYWQYQGPDGRKRAIAFAATGTHEPGPRIDLDAIDAATCPHLLLAMDGVPFELVDELYRDGRFRLFHPPGRVISCFPSMTDLALTQMFHAGRCKAYEASYYDRAARRMSDGNATYLSAVNSPWVRRMAYRCSFFWDGKAYLDPQAVFDHEMLGIGDAFHKIDTGEAFAYTVGTAGLGTRGGREAILRYLRAVDDYCERVVYERRGRVKLSLTADHGHNLTECRRVSFDDTLRRAGFRVTKSLSGPRDVIPIAYGLITYAGFYTDAAAEAADCLLASDDVELAVYRDGEAVVVRDRGGRALVRRTASGFIYDVREGDPLKLGPVLAALRTEGKVAPDGTMDDRALFEATVEHVYPDPLSRLWAAFHEVAEMPPDLVVTLRDGVCHGSAFFHAMIGKVASTHGSLNRVNSTAFLLTMLGPPPRAVRTADVLPTLGRMRNAEPSGLP